MYLPQIFCFCNGTEFKRFALPFIASINANSPGQNLFIYVVRPPKDIAQRASSLKKLASATELTIIPVNQPAIVREKNHPFLLINTLSSHIKKQKKDLIVIEISAIVKGDLLIFPNRLNRTDITCVPTMNSTRQYLLLWLRFSLKTLQFLKARLNASQIIALQNVSSCGQDYDKDIDFLSPDYFDHAIIWYRKLDKHNAALKRRTNEAINRLCVKFLSVKTIAIVMRRIDLPFKKNIKTTYASTIRRIQDQTRLYWQYYPKILRDALDRNQQSVELICLPMEQITPALLTRMPHNTIYLPHGNNQQFSDKRLRYYMQEIYPFFFTIDKTGWGATSSLYKCHEYKRINHHTEALEFAKNVRDKNITKYLQEHDHIPDFDVLFPLQVPNDDSLKFGSDYTLKDIVQAVITWAEKYKIRVLFKCHPVKPSIDYLGLNNGLTYARFIRNGCIHDIIRQSKVVFVANSGVGFEAMLHNKPVVSFAKAIYDVVTIQSGIDMASIQQAYNAARRWEKTNQNYLKFIQWYLFDVGTLLDKGMCHFNLGNTKIMLNISHYLNEMTYYRKSDFDKVAACNKKIMTRIARAVKSIINQSKSKVRNIFKKI